MRVGTFNNSQIRKLTSDLIVLVRVFHYIGELRDYPRMIADVWSSTIILPVNWAYNARSLIISDDLNGEQWRPVPLCSTTAETEVSVGDVLVGRINHAGFSCVAVRWCLAIITTEK